MLGDVIKALRKNERIYQQDLANALSVSKSTVAMWETNKRVPDAAMLVKIAKYFDVSVDYLLEKDFKATNTVSKTAECLSVSTDYLLNNDINNHASGNNARSVIIEKVSQLPEEKLDRLLGYLEGLGEE